MVGRTFFSFAVAVSGACLCAHATWRNVGPGGGGWIESIRVSDHAPDRMLVGCDVAGLFVSEDGGRSYSHGTEGLGHFFVETIAEHPVDPDFLLVGTLGGVYRSPDRGRTWSACRRGFPSVSSHAHSCPIARILPVPDSPDSFLAIRGNPRGMGGASIKVPQLYRTDDRGLSWSRVDAEGQLPSDTRVMDMAMTKGSPFGLVVTTSDRGVWRSDDGGVHWQESGHGLPHGRMRHVVSAPSDPRILYVALSLSTGKSPWDAGVCRSDDGGRTWRAVNGGLPTRTDPGGNMMLASWVNCLAVDPRNADVVYAGMDGWVTPGIYKTIDGGSSWRVVCSNECRQGWINFWGPSVECLSVGSRPPYAVAFGTPGYVFRSEDGGESWRQCYTRDEPEGCGSSIGLETTVLHQIVPDRAQPGKFYLCYYDIGLLVTEDRGKAFRRAVRGVKRDDANNCLSLVQAKDDPKVLFATFGQWYGSDGVVARSDDGGGHWRTLGREGGWRRGSAHDLVLMDDVAPYALACRVRGQGLAVSLDGGDNWRSVSTNAFAAVGRVSALAYVNGRLYAGVRGEGHSPGGVWCWDRVSGAAVFRPLTEHVSGFSDVQGLAVRGDDILVATRERFVPNGSGGRIVRGGVWHSPDCGKTWAKVLEEKFCSAVLFMRNGSWVAGTNDHAYHDVYRGKGLFVSVDRGRSWRNESDPSLAVPNVTTVTEDPFSDGTLWVGTNGGGVFVGKEVR